METWDYYTLLHRNLYWALALSTATKYLVQIEKMAADGSILLIVYAKKEPGRVLKAYT